MLMHFLELRRKEVINLHSGCRMGYVGDVELCVPEGTVKGVIVFGRSFFFGLFGGGEEYYIPWDCIQRFGSDILLVDKAFEPRGVPNRQKKRQRR